MAILPPSVNGQIACFWRMGACQIFGVKRAQWNGAGKNNTIPTVPGKTRRAE
jgi:hypothetical protein